MTGKAGIRHTVLMVILLAGLLYTSRAEAIEEVILRTGLLLSPERAAKLRDFIESKAPEAGSRFEVYSVQGKSGNTYYTLATPPLSPEEADVLKGIIQNTIPSIELTEVAPEKFFPLFVRVLTGSNTASAGSTPLKSLPAAGSADTPQSSPPGPSVTGTPAVPPGGSEACRVEILSPQDRAIVLDRTVRLNILLVSCLPAQVLIRLNGTNLAGRVPFEYTSEQNSITISGSVVPPAEQNTLEVAVLRNGRTTAGKSITFVFPQIGLPQ
jgi:hypothetical protein